MRFQSADVLCEQFNKFVSILKKKKEETNDKHPSLDENDEMSHTSDQEVLEKYVDLEKPCLLHTENKEVMDMWCKYNYVFSL